MLCPRYGDTEISEGYCWWILLELEDVLSNFSSLSFVEVASSVAQL